MLKGDLIGEFDCIPFRNRDIFRIPSVCVVTQHFTPHAELLITHRTVKTITAGNQVMQANSIPRLDRSNLVPYCLNVAGYLMSECHRQGVNRRLSSSIMDI